MNTTPTQVPDVYCRNNIEEKLVIHLCLIPAVVIIMVLSFFQTRERRWAMDLRLPRMAGHFGIAVPLEAMNSLSNRWSYGFAFGASSRVVFLLFSKQHILFPAPPWAQTFVFLFGAFEVGLVFFPFFACLSTTARGVGAVLGMLYTLAWLGVMLALVITCPHSQFLIRYGNLIWLLPTILSFFFLLGRFFLILVKTVQGRRQNQVTGEVIEHHVQYVKRLLRKPPPPGRESWFQRRVYKWDPHFRFPNRLIGTTIISLIGLYTLLHYSYVLSQEVFDGLDKLIRWLDQSNLASASASASIKEFAIIARKSWMMASITACLISLVYIFHVLMCYRKHMKRLWRGQRGFLPEKFRKNINPASSMAAIARYSGCQIAYTLWGYIIFNIVAFLAILIFAYTMIVPILHGQILKRLTTLGYSLLGLAVLLAVGCLQVYTVKVFFLQDKLSTTEKDKPLALNNRRAFNCFSYFFFFYNVVLGMSACALRLLVSLTVGLVLLPRIDRTIMPKGHETKDLGYTWWVGMIFADHYHGNPTLVCFCNLLWSRSPEPQAAGLYQPFRNTTLESGVHSRARKRWALAYTLLRNPPLILLRKHLASPPPCSTSAQAANQPSDQFTRTRRFVTAARTQTGSTAPSGGGTPPKQLNAQDQRNGPSSSEV
ncbi:STRA6-like isoform X1 [Gadus macrocephalus]|uniref:STRA6-like isoform X1 n=1 Tax=Gadus macrocephalus TaxID=80720 RepID=UPI0028CB48E1|nr:STRA6-like isoform X1 [Gadus macrocephalus]